ncbi:hypothetical protein COO60DRAFT_151543 [Scenedesmus sp. NREL 46B-D3]|nr:hypothetical protein COO60DRAFT_151543 [Scenedesmus sp. NREL 46B-D3]
MTLLYPNSIQPARSLSASSMGHTAATAGRPPAANRSPFSAHALHAALLPELQQAQAVLPYLVTGHINGMVVIWVTNSSSSSSIEGSKVDGEAAVDGAGACSSSGCADWLTPLLCIMPSSQCGPNVQGWLRGVGLSVKGLAVVEGTGMLCCGHSSGKIALHRLTPGAFQRAGAAWGLQRQHSGGGSGSSGRRRSVPEPEQWWPDSVVLQDAHVTGMDHLLAAPCVVNEGSPALLLFSAGKSGSVKRWKLRLSHVLSKLGVDGEAKPADATAILLDLRNMS